MRSTIAWTDPATGATVSSTALVIGHPWWTGGWYRPICWNQASGPPASVPAADQPLMFTDTLIESAGWRLWQPRHLGAGRLTMVGLPLGLSMKQDRWEQQLRRYVATVAEETAKATAAEGHMSISAPVPPWGTFESPRSRFRVPASR